MKTSNRSRKLNKVSRSFDSQANIVLQDKSVFSGFAIGARKKVVGEICFNTSMTGYQEIISAGESKDRDTLLSFLDRLLVFIKTDSRFIGT